MLGYGNGVFAPGRTSYRAKSPVGNSTEPYVYVSTLSNAPLFIKVSFASRVTHSVLIAHGYAVKLYREQFQPKQNGTIGITLDAVWFEPYTNTQQSGRAVFRFWRVQG